MLSRADQTHVTVPQRRLSLFGYLRLGAVGVTLFSLVDDPFVRLLLLLAAGLLALQALAVALCTMALRQATSAEGVDAEWGGTDAWRQSYLDDNVIDPRWTSTRT